MISPYQYFHYGSFDRVVRMLEPKIFEHRTDWKFYCYLGYSSLYTGDYIKANSYLQRALQLNPKATELMHGIAVLHLKRGESGDAVRLWLHILDKNPEDKYAKIGLDFVNSTGTKEMPSLLSLKKCRTFLPCSANRKKLYLSLAIVAGIIIASLAVAMMFVLKTYTEAIV